MDLSLQMCQVPRGEKGITSIFYFPEFSLENRGFASIFFCGLRVFGYHINVGSYHTLYFTA